MSSSQDIVTNRGRAFYKKRRAARVLAVQCLYNIALTPEEIKAFEDIVKDIMEYGAANDNDIDQQYFLLLIHGCYKNIKVLYAHVQKYLLKNWTVSRLPEVIQAILVLGTYEIIYNVELAHSITINEYVAISKIFNHEGEYGFVNSVLDKVSKEFSR